MLVQKLLSSINLCRGKKTFKMGFFIIFTKIFVKLISREKSDNFFRYVIGGQFLNIFTEFYLNTSIYNLTPTDPKWVGAWWLGFILIFVLSMICGLLICIFPAKMSDNNAKNEKKTNIAEQNQDDNENV